MLKPVFLAIAISSVGYSATNVGLRVQRNAFLKAYEDSIPEPYKRLKKEDPIEDLKTHANFAISFVESLSSQVPYFLTLEPTPFDLLHFLNLPSKLGRGQLHEKTVGNSFEVIQKFYADFFERIRNYPLSGLEFGRLLSYQTLPASEWETAQRQLRNRLFVDLMMRYPTSEQLETIAGAGVRIPSLVRTLAYLRGNNSTYDAGEIILALDEVRPEERNMGLEILSRQLTMHGPATVTLTRDQLKKLRKHLVDAREMKLRQRVMARVWSGNYGGIEIRSQGKSSYVLTSMSHQLQCQGMATTP